MRLVPCLLLLPPWLGTLGVWISIPIADLTAAIATAILFRMTTARFAAQSGKD